MRADDPSSRTIRGTVVRLDGVDGLGEVELADGRNAIFGCGACRGCDVPPAVGARVVVADLRRSPTGRLKAYRVEPTERPTDDPCEDHDGAPFERAPSIDPAS